MSERGEIEIAGVVKSGFAMETLSQDGFISIIALIVAYLCFRDILKEIFDFKKYQLMSKQRQARSAKPSRRKRRRK